MSKILIFGDVMGKPGRKALAQVLPSLKAEHKPDIILANVENLAHGKGVTPSTMQELTDLGIDVFTSGNHVFDKAPQAEECFEKYPNLIRPANYTDQLPGSGYYRLSKNGQQYLVINLGGKVFFENQYRGTIANPFFTIDKLLAEQAQKGDIIIVDFHAEATSEKIAMGWHLEGRVSALYGTHTHVPTADFQILPKGTAYVTDVGMSGPKHSVIGVQIENSLNMFLEKGKVIMDVAEEGPAMVNAIVIETDGTNSTSVRKIYIEV